MQTNGKIDWLTCTLHGCGNIRQALPGELNLGLFAKLDRGFNGYTEAFRADCGALVQMSERTDMGININLPGTAMALVRESGMTERELCIYLDSQGAKASRIDLALDILQPRELTPAFFEAEYRAGRVLSAARQLSARRDTDGKSELGAGVYLGAPTSDRMLRVYDKGLETKSQDANRWIRFELQCRREQSQAHMRAVIEIPNTRAIVNKAIANFVTMDSQEFKEAIVDRDAEIDPVPRKEHATLTWLLDQTAPAAAAFQVDHPDIDVAELWLAKFLAEVKSKTKTSRGLDRNLDEDKL
jgi:DNA relaxase NicK